jgi:hypothetical protein
MTMFAIQGPRQTDGVCRYYGWRQRKDLDEAKRSIARDRTMIDAIAPDAIVDVSGTTARFVSGSDADCRALAKEAFRCLRGEREEES